MATSARGRKAENPYFYRAEQIAERWLSHPDQTDEPTCGPGPFSMSNADTTSGVLKAAGFEEISLTRCGLPIMLGEDLDRAVGMVTSIGPAGELIRINKERGAAKRGDRRQDPILFPVRRSAAPAGFAAG